VYVGACVRAYVRMLRADDGKRVASVMPSKTNQCGVESTLSPATFHRIQCIQTIDIINIYIHDRDRFDLMSCCGIFLTRRCSALVYTIGMKKLFGIVRS
jgi:hypothetical protein